MLRSLDVPSEIVTPELTDLCPLGIGRRSGQASLLLGGGTLSWSQRLLKRSFDLAVTVPVLPLLLPLLAAIALVVKLRSEEHTSELQSLMRLSYAVLCLI